MVTLPLMFAEIDVDKIIVRSREGRRYSAIKSGRGSYGSAILSSSSWDRDSQNGSCVASTEATCLKCDGQSSQQYECQQCDGFDRGGGVPCFEDIAIGSRCANNRRSAA